MLSFSPSPPRQPSLRLCSHALWQCRKTKAANHWEQGKAGEGTHAGPSLAAILQGGKRVAQAQGQRGSLGQAERGARSRSRLGAVRERRCSSARRDAQGKVSGLAGKCWERGERRSRFCTKVRGFFGDPPPSDGCARDTGDTPSCRGWISKPGLVHPSPSEVWDAPPSLSLHQAFLPEPAKLQVYLQHTGNAKRHPRGAKNPAPSIEFLGALGLCWDASLWLCLQ